MSASVTDRQPDPDLRIRQPGEDETHLIRVAAIIVRGWRWLVLIPFLAGVATGLISFLIPPSYTASSSFIPEARGQSRVGGGLGNLAGLATQFGVSLGADPTASPRFYASVAESREILERLILTRYPDPTDQSGHDSLTLMVLLGKGGRDSADSLDRGLKALHKRLSVSVDNQTNIVSVDLRLSGRNLAAAATNSLVEYLNDFNSHVRRSQAGQRRVFVEGRVADGEAALRDAEQQLKDFYERNRSWQQAPQLVYEEGRLKREVDIQQAIYLSLEQELETARIDEVNDVPLITIIDKAVPPVQRAWPRRTLLVLMAICLATMTTLVGIFAADYVERARQGEGAEFGQLTTAITSARQQVRRLLGRRAHNQ